MNNSGSANVVILKRLTVKKADNNLKSYKYPVTAVTQSQKKNLEAKKFQFTSWIIKPVRRNSEKPHAYQISRNLDQSNNRTIWLTFLSLPHLEDKEIDNSVTLKDNGYFIEGMLSLNQDKQVQFNDQDDRVND